MKKIEYEEIRKATRNFHIHKGIVTTNLYAAVYKGWIHEEDLTAMKPGCGTAVAVKIMNLEGFQQHKECVVGVSSPTSHWFLALYFYFV